MKTTIYRDKASLRWILFEDRVAPRHHRQLPDGVDRCVGMLQPARTTLDGVSYMASCRTAMSRGQRRVFESHASDIDLPSKPPSKYIVTSHSLQPKSSAQSSPTSDSILCTAHALLESCCHMKATLLILTIAYPGAWEVLVSCRAVQCFTHVG